MANYIDATVEREKGDCDVLAYISSDTKDHICVCYSALQKAGVTLDSGQKKRYRITFKEIPMGAKSDLASKRKPPAKKLKRRYKLKPGFPVNLQSGRKK